MPKVPRAQTHESMVRLLACARKATVNQRNPVREFPDIAAAFGVEPQNMNNWFKRGLSKPLAIEAERLWGCPAVWLLYGTEPPKHGVELPTRDPPSDSEWALLEGIRDLPEEELERLQQRIAKNAEHIARVRARYQGEVISDKGIIPVPPIDPKKSSQ